MNLSTIIKQARVGKYTQTEMALCLGMSQANYANIENGHTHPNAETLLTIARLLGIDLNKIAAGVNVISFHKIISDHRNQKAQNAQRKTNEG